MARSSGSRTAAERPPRLRIATLAAAVVLAVGLAAAPVDAKPARTGGLRGAVVDHAGIGLAKATVTAYALPGLQGCDELENEWRPVASTTSGAGGSYTLNVSAGTYRIGVVPFDRAVDAFGYRVETTQGDGSNVTSWVGYADDVLVPTAGRSGLDVHLTTPVAVHGTVVDDIGGAVAGAEVRAVPVRLGQWAKNVPTVLTDAAGSYTIAGLPTVVPAHPVFDAEGHAGVEIDGASRYGLVFRDPTGWHGVWLWWFTYVTSPPGSMAAEVDVSDPDTLEQDDVVLQRTGRLNGRVVDERGRPVAGVEVSPTYAFGELPAVTDGTGRFTVPWQTEGQGPGGPGTIHVVDRQGRYESTYYPGVRYEEQAGSAIPPLPTVSSEQALTVKVRSGAARITGYAWYSVGMPAAGATVQAFDPLGYGVALRAGDQATVGCDGSFTVTGLWPGAYRLGFTPVGSDDPPTQSRLVNVTSKQTLQLGTVEMPTWVIRGVVHDGTGDGPGVGGIQVDLVAEVDSNGQPLGMQRLADYGMPSARTITSAAAGYPEGIFGVFLTSPPNGSLYLTFSDPQGRFPTQVYRNYPAGGFGALVDLWSGQWQPQFDADAGTGPWLNDVVLHRAFITAARGGGTSTVTVAYSDPVDCTASAALEQWTVGAVHPTAYSCNAPNEVVLDFSPGVAPVPGSVVQYAWDGDLADAVLWLWPFDSATPPGPGSSWFPVRPYDTATLDQPVIVSVGGGGTDTLTVTFSQGVACTDDPAGAFTQQWTATIQQPNQPLQFVSPGSYACPPGNEVSLTFPAAVWWGSQLSFNPNGNLTSDTSPPVPAGPQQVGI